jgi:general secretion pathway protein G
VKPRNARAGVTLIEMLVVVTIIALFAALVIPNVPKYLDRGRITKAHADLEGFMTALTSYNAENGVYPTTEQGLQSLRVKPPNVESWHGPYLTKEIPNDPWGHPYVYKFPGEHGDVPDIISYGADGAPGGEGTAADIVSWK